MKQYPGLSSTSSRSISSTILRNFPAIRLKFEPVFEVLPLAQAWLDLEQGVLAGQCPQVGPEQAKPVRITKNINHGQPLTAM